jgi:hypothetical protein
MSLKENKLIEEQIKNNKAIKGKSLWRVGANNRKIFHFIVKVTIITFHKATRTQLT